MHALTGASWKRNTNQARVTEMKDTSGNPAAASGSETYRPIHVTAPALEPTLLVFESPMRNAVRAEFTGST